MKHTSKILLISMVLVAGVLLSACSGALPINAWPGISADASAVYVAEGAGVFAYSSNDGSLVWRYPEKAEGTRVFYSSPIKGPEGTLIVGDYAGGIASLDMKTGKERWWFKGAKGRFIASPIMANSTILAANADHSLYALDLNGTLIWTFTAPEQIWTSPASNGNKVYVASVDQHLYAVGLNDGKQLWSVKLEGSVIGAPVSGPDNMVFAGTSMGNFYALNGETGAEVWKTVIGKSIWSAPLLKDGILYVGVGDGNLVAVSAGDGSVKWKVSLGDAVIGSPALTTNSLLVPVENGEIVSVSLSGEKQWGRSVNGKLYTAPIIDGQKVFVAIKGEKLVAAFDINGNELWKIDPPK